MIRNKGNKSNITGATLVFCGVRVARSLVFFWPLLCLSFDLRPLITHLVSSNFITDLFYNSKGPKVVSSNPAHGEVFLIQHYVIKCQ
jgi:hypothetical protein